MLSFLFLFLGCAYRYSAICDGAVRSCTQMRTQLLYGPLDFVRNHPVEQVAER